MCAKYMYIYIKCVLMQDKTCMRPYHAVHMSVV